MKMNKSPQQDSQFKLTSKARLNKILFICSWADKHIGLFDDLQNDKRVILRCFRFKDHNRLFRKFERIHLSEKVNKIINIPYKHVWTTLPVRFSSFDSVIVTNNVLPSVTDYVNLCKKKGKQVNLFVVDAMDADSFIMKTARPLILNMKFDHIFTFEPADVKKYGFEYLGFGGYYSKKDIEIPSTPKYDLVFTGGVKGGRQETIIELYKYLEKEACNFIFDLNSIPFYEDKNIRYHYGWIPYEDFLKTELDSNCILEIVQEGQTGPTLRYFEAICYNKKLLTNNPNIVDFPFYNSQWMKIFNSPEDIDIAWVKKKENINYRYQGEFSPTKMIDKLYQKT